MILQSLAGLPAFLLYFCTAIIAVVAYLLVYTRVKPHNEFQLIRDNDPAASARWRARSASAVAEARCREMTSFDWSDRTAVGKTG
jgi:uncharacterized protein DUF350